MPFTPYLPREIWVKIFRIANASRDIQQINYRPFQYNQISYSQDRKMWKETAIVRLTLVLVCKLWRSLANELIYEEIRTRIAYYNALKYALEKRGKETGDDEGCGRLVRLLDLPRHYSYDFDILKYVPQLEVLVVDPPFMDPDTSASNSGQDAMSLPEMRYLKRPV